MTQHKLPRRTTQPAKNGPSRYPVARGRLAGVRKVGGLVCRFRHALPLLRGRVLPKRRNQASRRPCGRGRCQCEAQKKGKNKKSWRSWKAWETLRVILGRWLELCLSVPDEKIQQLHLQMFAESAECRTCLLHSLLGYRCFSVGGL